MPQKHNRKSIRLKGYDYSSEGLYFITICTQNRIHQFGKIVNGKMILNTNGEIALHELQNTEIIRKGNVILHSYVVMPNHVHFIIQIINSCRGVPRTPLGKKENDVGKCNTPLMNIGNNRGVCNTPLRAPSNNVGAIVRGYKCSVSKQIGFPIWQRNYYECIIRTQKSYENISNYIQSNPSRWHSD